MNVEITFPAHRFNGPTDRAAYIAPNDVSSEHQDGPDITVVMPVFNCESFLPTRLASLLEHQQVNLEVIAVDDGSQDRSLTLLRDYAARDPRLKVLSQANAGPSVARNLALRHARGEWIVFADADDRMSSNGLAEWLTQARHQRLDLLIGNGYRFIHDTEVARRPMLKRQPWGNVLPGSAWIEHCVQVREWPHYSPLQMIRREFLTRHDLAFPSGVLHEDVLWTTELALAAKRVGFNRSPLYGYRRNPDSIVNSTLPARLMLRGRGYVAIIAMLLERASHSHYPASLRRAFIQHAHSEMRHFSDLVRKAIKDGETRRALCHEMARIAPWKPLLRSVSRYEQLRRLARAYLTVTFSGRFRGRTAWRKQDAPRR